MLKLVKNILKVFQDNNLFDEGIELIGSWCFMLYQKHLGVKPFPLRTQDIDFLIPLPFKGKYHPDFINQLENLGFQSDFYSDGSLFLWNSELKIEFITIEKGQGSDRSTKIKELGFNAIPIRFVNLLLENPITIKEKGIKILVPNPSNFCLQKLIIASRRKKEEKKLKDTQQAVFVSEITNKKDLTNTYLSLPKKWQKKIIQNLNETKDDLPLFNTEINKLLLTLQNIN